MTTPEGRPLERIREPYRISTDPALLDIELMHRFLTGSYWSPGIPLETVKRAVEASLPFGLYRGRDQIGFARVVTDRATFAYLCDVFVLPEFRGRGLARWLCETVLAHPELQGLRRWMLATRDAHPLYASLGFAPLDRPGTFMQINDDDIYRR